MERTGEDVDLFIAGCGQPEAMARLDALVREALPDAGRVLWRGDFWGGGEQAIIGYGDLRQQRPRGKTVEWFLVGLALQKRHFSLYVNAVRDGRYLGQAYGASLGKVRVGSAAITFASPDSLDAAEVREMLAEAARQLPAQP
ncbi:MAG: DUF1801 domain-containing protein [Actinobacteria bacterium]|nr:DUF1801 domain-containing protein [Actinomycetota bacterium]